MSDITIRQPDDAEYEVVKKYVDLFWLDKSDMRIGQFKILLLNGVIAAFARLKNHRGGAELCTFGVVKKFRGRRLGITLLNAILSGVERDVFLITIEPEYFKKAGFRIAIKYPPVIREKRDMCLLKFPVGKMYRVMVHRLKGTINR